MIARIVRLTENSNEAEYQHALLMLLDEPPAVNLFYENLVCTQ